MRILVALLVLALASLACETEEVVQGPQPPTTLPAQFIFEFRTVAAVVDSQKVTIYDDGDMTCADLKSGRICADFDEIFISFELLNKSNEKIKVLWSAGRWIDEFGVAHQLARHPGDQDANDHTVEPGEIYRVTHFPAEKNYLVPDKENAYYFSEPIVPWDMRSGDPDAKRHVMMESRTPVFLMVPIVGSEGPQSVMFEFQIFPREEEN